MIESGEEETDAEWERGRGGGGKGGDGGRRGRRREVEGGRWG